MNGQEHSAAVVSAQRAVADHKQTTSIRKITIDSIAPVLAELEQHIGYLLQETAALRAQNGQLVATAATQQQLEAQVCSLGVQLEELGGRQSAGERQATVRLQESRAEKERAKGEVAKLAKEVESLGQQLQEVSSQNAHYLQLIDDGKQQHLQSVEELKRSIEQYYEQEIIRIDALHHDHHALTLAIDTLTHHRLTDNQEVAKLARVTALYESEREDYRKLLERTTLLETNCVKNEDYEQDKKYQRIANELLRKDIQDMLERALTPEIRRFLPQLIAKLASLEAFETQLAALEARSLAHHHAHQEAVELLAKQWEHRHQELAAHLDSAKTNHQIQLEQEIERIESKISLQEATMREQLERVERAEKAGQAEWQRQLKVGLGSLERDIKDYLKEWGNNFIASKKEEIYSAVQTLKPPAELQQNQKLADTVNEMEPLIRQVRTQLEQARSEMQTARDSLADKLAHFNNQIVKMKTDLGKESSDVRRSLERFELRLQEAHTLGEQLSGLGAVLTQTAIMQLAMSMEPSFLRLPHEVYVTYSDGILCELHHESNLLTYRRKSLQPELLKRAAMKQFVVLVDNIIQQQPLLGWHTPHNKPSHFFALILENYNALAQEHSLSIGPNPSSLKRQPQSPQVPFKGRTSSLRRRFPKGEALSQTLDLPTEGRSTGRYGKEEQVNLRQVKLKKIEQKGEE